jgi:hypothetical protein
LDSLLQSLKNCQAEILRLRWQEPDRGGCEPVWDIGLKPSEVLRELECMKSNFGPSGEVIRLRSDNGVFKQIAESSSPERRPFAPGRDDGGLLKQYLHSPRVVIFSRPDTAISEG